MNSPTLKTRNFLINNHIRKCESTLKSSDWRSLLSSPGRLIRVKMSRLNLRTHRTVVRVAREVLVGLDALLLSLGAQINKRILIGVGLMGVAAPLVSCFYMLFDKAAFDETWYHASYFHLFLLLGPSLFILTCLIGAFFLFPAGSKRAYALSVPAGFTVGKILWLIQCTSNADFYSVVPLSFVLIGALISVFIFVAIDWLAYNKFHREDAFEARMTGIVNLADDFDDAKFKSMVKTVWREKKAFRKQF